MTASTGTDERDQLIERLKLEAQAHAQEARTANATIAEIYQVVTGSTGEPGNWNGAEPVRKCIEDLRASLGAAQVPAPRDLIAGLGEHFHRKVMESTDQSVTEPFKAWLDGTSHNGVGANEAWNAGVAFAQSEGAAQVPSLVALAKSMVASHEEHGIVLTIHMKEMAELVAATAQLSPCTAQMSIPSDAQITEIAHVACKKARLNWVGFLQDADGKWTVPSISPSVNQLVREVVAALSPATEAVPSQKGTK